MVGAFNLLIVSSRLELKRALRQVLNGLPLNTYIAGSVQQAQDSLEKQGIDAVLCDECISDGTYKDVLERAVEKVPKNRFILLLTAGGAEEYREARQRGVAEVVRSRYEPTDLELALLHAIRGKIPMTQATL